MTSVQKIMYNKYQLRSLKDYYINPAKWFWASEGGEIMSEVRVNNGNIEDALKRFKRQCARNGVLQEVRKREHYEKPSVKRKKKSEAARKRM